MPRPPQPPNPNTVNTGVCTAVVTLADGTTGPCNQVHQHCAGHRTRLTHRGLPCGQNPSVEAMAAGATACWRHDPDDPRAGQRAKVQRVIDRGPCEACGLVHEHCAGHLRHNHADVVPLVPCGHQALLDTVWCHAGGHNGKQLQARARAKLAEERELAEAQAALNEMRRDTGIAILRPTRGRFIADAPVTIDNLTAQIELALGKLIAENNGTESLVRQLEDAVSPATREVDDETGEQAVDGLTTWSPTSGLDVHPFVKLHERATDRKLRWLFEAAKLGIEERRLAIDSGEADVVLRALLNVLDRNGVDMPELRSELAAELAALTTGSP